jgi:hypothetical protein
LRTTPALKQADDYALKTLTLKSAPSAFMLSMLCCRSRSDDYDAAGRVPVFLGAHGQHVVITIVNSIARNAVDSGFSVRFCFYDLFASVAFSADWHSVKEYLVSVKTTPESDTELGSARSFGNMQVPLPGNSRGACSALGLPTAGYLDRAPLTLVAPKSFPRKIIAGTKQPVRRVVIICSLG